MLGNFFEKTKPINSIVLCFVFCIYYFTHIYFLEEIDIKDTNWLPASFNFILNFLFLFFSTIVFSKNEVLNDNLQYTFLMILFYGMFPNTFTADHLILVSILFLLIYNKLSKLETNGRKKPSLFDCGMYVGISVLFYNWTIVFLIYILLCILLAHKMTLKNLIRPVLGFTTPLFLLYTFSFVTDSNLFNEKFNFDYSFNFDIYANPAIQIPLIILLAVLTISIFSVLPRVFTVSGPFRFQYIVSLQMLLIGITAVLFTAEKNGSEFLLVFVPASIILGHFVKIINHRGIKEALFLGLSFTSVFLLIKHL